MLSNSPIIFITLGYKLFYSGNLVRNGLLNCITETRGGSTKTLVLKIILKLIHNALKCVMSEQIFW